MEQQIKIDVLKNLETTRKRIDEFTSSNLLREIKESLARKSYLEILGKGRDETLHSSFLAWLLDSHESHDLGCQPMQLFLALLVKRRIACDENIQTLPDNLCDAIVTGRTKIEDVTTNTEVFLGDKGRADIVANVKLQGEFDGMNYLCIIIENKIFSSEHDEQTSKYDKYYVEKDINSVHNIFVYLTPDSDFTLQNLTKPQCECKKFIQINYQDLYSDVFSCLLKREHILPSINFMLTDYVTNLGVTVNLDEKYNKTEKNVIPLAMTKEQKKLLIDFYETNQDILKAVIQAIYESPSDIDLSDSETLDKAKEIFMNKKDTSSYTYCYDGGDVHEIPQYLRENANKPNDLTKANLIWDIINVYINNNNDVSFDSLAGLNGAFPPSLQNGSLKAIALVDEAKKRDNRYYPDIIKLACGTCVRVCSEWGVSSDLRYSTFDRFINQAETLKFVVNIKNGTKDRI